MTKKYFLGKIKEFKLNEETAGASTGGLTASSNVGGTNTLSVMGTTDSPNFGGFIGPLSRVSKNKLNKRILWKWKGAKNSAGSGVGKLVEPPQGYVSEYLYSDDGNMITEGNLTEWFGQDLKQKPSFNGGKLVAIEPKCLAFPYCSQGAVDKPIRLIGENKNQMCKDCYDYCSHIAEQTKKTPEYIAKLIREKYLSDTTLDESIELKNKKGKFNEMRKINTSKIRALMHEMAYDENVKGCMYEILSMEGYLPETLNEGDDYDQMFEAMMEDDDMVMEIYKSITMNESSCGSRTKEFMENYDSDMVSEYDKEAMGSFKKQYGDKRGKEVYYATANKQDRSPETFEKNESESIFGESVKRLNELYDKLAPICNKIDNGKNISESTKKAIDMILNISINPKKTIKENVFESYDDDEDDDEDDDSGKTSTSSKAFSRVMRALEVKIKKIHKEMLGLNIDDYEFSRAINKMGFEGDYLVTEFLDFISREPDESDVNYYLRLTKTGDSAFRKVFIDIIDSGKRRLFSIMKIRISDQFDEMLFTTFDALNRAYNGYKKVRLGDVDTTGADVRPYSMPSRGSNAGYLTEKASAVKGKGVDSDNKKNSNKDTSDIISGAKKSQKTVNQKVDAIKNNKYKNNDWEGNVDGISHGWRNNLDLDYPNGISDEQIKKITDQVLGKVPRDHANVDHDSEAGNKLLKGAKSRADDQFVGDDDYTSASDSTRVEPRYKESKKTIFNGKGKTNESKTSFRRK